MRAPGKKIGGCTYLHKSYADERVAPYKTHLPDRFNYALVKINSRTDAVSFIRCDDFDTAHEPTVGTSVLVRADGTTKMLTPGDDPWIYHHKWQMVADDYQGFDVQESKDRSASWDNLDIDRSRIGKKSYWVERVLPNIPA